MTQDLTFKPATELLGLMAAKELSPVELLEACLARIEALDGKINAFTHMLTDEARAAALECETRIQRGENGPLEGVPVPIKDLALVWGTPITMGSRMSMEFRIMIDSEVVARLRAAGAVIPGKTHMPEFGSTMSSESVKFGATRNPWNLERSPGGSSSGARRRRWRQPAHPGLLLRTLHREAHPGRGYRRSRSETSPRTTSSASSPTRSRTTPC